jgi:hypothetical protein
LEEILNLGNELGFAYVEKYNIKMDIKQTRCEGMD